MHNFVAGQLCNCYYVFCGTLIYLSQPQVNMCNSGLLRLNFWSGPGTRPGQSFQFKPLDFQCNYQSSLSDASYENYSLFKGPKVQYDHESFEKKNNLNIFFPVQILKI